MDLKQILRQVPDFPKPGINFIDITTLLANPSAFQWAIDALAAPFDHKLITKVVAIESRGFIFGAPLALRWHAGFVPLRKPNKLPAKTYSHTYQLEYGQDTIEIHQDAIAPGDRVVIIDDLLATGGTLQASLELLKNFQCTIEGITCVVELTFLNGREKLKTVPVHTLVTYDSE
ncbi:MAG: adenine phosphoribosyltransferase [Candidatus Omnitrophota bacterium]|jgi:adenine phosphoribosyltransferase|nr:MAG: adenine phosphoribosyltransferase [Candidatus Omnitrophota bacterium]